MQLAVPDPGGAVVLLLHVAVAGLPPGLRALLAAPAPLKVGCGAHGDALKVQRDFGLAMAGVLDLGGDYASGRLAADAHGAPPQRWSLAALAARLLRHGLDKGQALRCSDWERCPLAAEQVQGRGQGARAAGWAIHPPSDCYFSGSPSWRGGSPAAHPCRTCVVPIRRGAGALCSHRRLGQPLRVRGTAQAACGSPAFTGGASCRAAAATARRRL